MRFAYVLKELPLQQGSFAQRSRIVFLQRLVLRRCAGSGALARDVVFELLDRELLFGNNVLYQVADRDHADQPLLINHRQMAYAAVSH
jgi:hypothetical protein